MSRLWYKQCANCWEQALPIGNGRIGGMVFGGNYYEMIYINEETLWTGNPKRPDVKYDMGEVEKIRGKIRERDYKSAEKEIIDMMKGEHSESYLSPGRIFIDFNNSGNGHVESYKRSLDLDTAVCSVETALNDRNFKEMIRHKREYFVSFADDVMVFKIGADYKYLSFDVAFEPKLNATVEYINDEIIVTGRCSIDGGKDEAIPYRIIIKAVCDGNVRANGAQLCVRAASDAVFIMSVATGFNGFDKMPESEGRDYKKECREKLEKALTFGFDELKARHIEKYREIYGSCSIKLSDEADDIPTDERLKRVSEGASDNKLVEMLFDYGRYLLVSSSEKGGQAANLQGIWTKKLIPEWLGNYTTNINTQMNYWAAESVGLSACHMPLLEMIKDLSKKGNHYGLRGWVCCHNSDIWRFNREATKGVYAYWQMGGIWLCRHIYEHFAYTRDLEFLKEYMPVLKGAFEFLEDWLVADGEFLTTIPSVSPENAFFFEGEKISASKGSTMDISIIKDFLENMIELSKVLGEDSEKYERILKRLPPFKVGSDGRLLEWCEEFEETDRHHRHVSHLFGIYPSKILEGSPELIEATKKSLAVRLEENNIYIGWFNAWVANIYARLKEPQKALERMNFMIRHCMYDNLFDSHPPFQMDGNSGVTAAVAEMLVQSHRGKIELAPSVPHEWENISVKGLKARGGYTVSYEIRNAKVTEYSILDKDGNIPEIEVVYPA